MGKYLDTGSPCVGSYTGLLTGHFSFNKGVITIKGMITFKFEGMTLFKANVWEAAALLLFRGRPPLDSMPDQIFIDDKEILKPENMEDDS